MSDTVGQIQPTVIPFNEIPNPPFQTPGSYLEIQPNYQNIGLLPIPARALIIAQCLTASTGPQGVATNITRVQDATALWDAGSQIEMMVRAFFANNQAIPLDVVAVPDAGGATKASGTFTVSGTWTTAGTLPLYIGGRRIAIGVGATDAPAAVAANAVAAINGYLPITLPVTAAAGTGGNTNQIILTARHGGLSGNTIDMYVGMQPGDILPAGMTCAITAMNGGATNPTVTAAITAITGIWYTDIMVPWQDVSNLTTLSAELDRRFTAMVKEDGHLFGCITGSYGTQMSTKASVNGKCVSLFGITNPPSTPWEIAAAFGGVASYYTLQDPSRQLRDLALAGIVGSRPQDRLTAQEQEFELEGGVCPFNVLSDGTVTLMRVVTTYLTNAEGAADPSFHDIMTPKTLTRVRYDWRTYTRLIYPRNKLAPDGSLAAEYDLSVVTPSRAKASWAARERIYEQNGWLVNGAANNQAANFFIDPNDPNRLDYAIPISIIGNLIVLAGLLEFNLG